MCKGVCVCVLGCVCVRGGGVCAAIDRTGTVFCHGCWRLTVNCYHGNLCS